MELYSNTIWKRSLFLLQCRRFNLNWTYSFCLVSMIKFSICFPRMPKKRKCFGMHRSQIFRYLWWGHSWQASRVYQAHLFSTSCKHKRNTLIYRRSFLVCCWTAHKRGEKHIPQGAIGAYLHTHCTRAIQRGCALYWAQRDKYEKKKYQLLRYLQIHTSHSIQRRGHRRKKCFVRGPSYLSVRWFSILHTCQLFF